MKGEGKIVEEEEPQGWEYFWRKKRGVGLNLKFSDSGLPGWAYEGGGKKRKRSKMDVE